MPGYVNYGSDSGHQDPMNRDRNDSYRIDEGSQSLYRKRRGPRILLFKAE